ncbi:DUF2218 domain-containing protein [Aquabacterium sp.]|uniref:DUF2218 domain-containing protein n=1 Tax=Aquabacterium sp. TaxID=1872578 RepID=UPI004037CDCB
MSSSQCTALTHDGAAILYKLCKHFAKKIPASWSEDRRSGKATFEWGVVTFHSSDAALQIECMAPDDVTLDRLEAVITQHLQLMSRRDPLEVRWRRDQAS